MSRIKEWLSTSGGVKPSTASVKMESPCRKCGHDMYTGFPACPLGLDIKSFASTSRSLYKHGANSTPGIRAWVKGLISYSGFMDIPLLITQHKEVLINIEQFLHLGIGAANSEVEDS